MNTETHPSFLELDRVPLHQAAPQTTDHVKGCARCQAHLRKLEEPIAVPAWATALRRPAPAPKPSWWTLVLLGAAATAGAAAVVLLSSRPHPIAPPRPQGTLVAAKGSPSVALYLKRGAQVTLWDGHSPVQSGDRLRLEVGPEGLGNVLVAAPGGLAQPLFSGAVDPKRATLLPTSWLVDESPGPEALVVVLSAAPLSANDASAALSAHRRDDRVWTTELTLPKASK
jgi:hypothetical protein